MDRKEVKRALHVFRPDELEPIPSPVADALDLAERDPRLKAWWEAEQAFDRAVADKLSDVPIPEDLRNSILASRTVVPIRPQPQFSFWLAAAAVFAICCTLGTSQLIKAMSPMPRGEYTAAILPLLNHDAPDLGLTSNDHDQIMTWLKARHAPTGSLPSKMTSLSMVGCQKYSVHGRSVSLICFAMADGAIAHLFIVRKDALMDPPGSDAPEMNQVNGWSTASWSDDQMSYVLATQASSDALKQLL